jgi:predicted Zn-dependent peptidase
MGRDIGGSKSSVSGISRQNLIAYHRNQYTANNTVIAVAGHISHETVSEAVHDRLGAMPVGSPITWQPVIPVKNTESPVVIENRRTDQAHMCLAFPGVSFNDPNRYTVSLINTIIGEGQASRLFTEIRERNGLAYDVSSSTSFYRDCGSVIVYCGVNPSKAQDALRGILLELDKLRMKISQEELKRAVDYTKGRMLLRFEDTGTVMSALGTQAILSGMVRTPQEIIQGLERVTIDEIQHVAESLLNYQNYRLSIVGPHKSATQFLSHFK